MLKELRANCQDKVALLKSFHVSFNFFCMCYAGHVNYVKFRITRPTFSKKNTLILFNYLFTCSSFGMVTNRC